MELHGVKVIIPNMNAESNDAKDLAFQIEAIQKKFLKMMFYDFRRIPVHRIDNRDYY